MNPTFRLTERNRRIREELRLERQNKAERCRETDGDAERREVREKREKRDVEDRGGEV